MQDNPAEQLHVEMHHVPLHRLIADRETMLSIFQTAGRIFHNRKRFRQNLVQPLPLVLEVGNLRQFFLPHRSFRAQCFVGQVLELLIELVDAMYNRHQALELTLIFRP